MRTNFDELVLEEWDMRLASAEQILVVLRITM